MLLKVYGNRRDMMTMDKAYSCFGHMSYLFDKDMGILTCSGCKHREACKKETGITDGYWLNGKESVWSLYQKYRKRNTV